MDGKLMSNQAAKQKMQQLAKDDPDLQVVISADMELPYREVVAVVDLVKIAGVNSFALNVERKVPPAGR